MNKTYLILLSTDYDRDKVKAFFDQHPSVSFWFFNLPYSIFLRTTMSAQQVSQLLTTHFGENRHFVTEVTANRWGILPKNHWKYFI